MLEKLACASGRNDEVPNIELAIWLCENEDKEGISEIVSGLKSKDTKIANDAIKVLYEIGARKPVLIADHADQFISLLSGKNNRLIWGGMTALAAIADLAPEKLYAQADKILAAFYQGSVITVDNGVTVLAKLCRANRQYKEELFPLLLEHLGKCRPKEVAQHAERVAICVEADTISDFYKVLRARDADLSEAQKKRIDKLERRMQE